MVGYTVNAVYHPAKRYLVLDTVPTSITAALRMTFPSSRCMEAVMAPLRGMSLLFAWRGIRAPACAGRVLSKTSASRNVGKASRYRTKR
jgi:hypothetical protein